MFQNWLLPIELDEIIGTKLSDYQLGNNIIFFNKTTQSISDAQIALIGIGEKDANAVRKGLYTMSFPFKDLKIIDLGNVRKTQIAFTIPIILELFDSGIFPLIIGSDPHFLIAQYKAFQSIKPFINVVTIDESPKLSLKKSRSQNNYLNELIDSETGHLFHFGLIGCQYHFTNPEVYLKLEEQNFDCIRLGQAKANLEDLEPIIRDADLLHFNLSALKQAEAPGQVRATPSGFNVEEACQICRYAGMSDKLRSFGLFGFRKALDRKQQTAQVAAQMIWYLLDGFYNRKNDFPASNEGMTEYIVEVKEPEYQLTFWKSQKSGRWWLQVPLKIKEDLQRHYLIPCSYDDYIETSQGELPDRLFNAFSRFF